MRSLEKHLRKAIEDADMTHMELALRAGVPQASISMFMNGKRPGLVIATAGRLMDVLGLNIIPSIKKKKKPARPAGGQKKANAGGPGR